MTLVGSGGGRLTVSAAVRLMPSPPALVLSKKMKISDLQWYEKHCITFLVYNWKAVEFYR